MIRQSTLLGVFIVGAMSMSIAAQTGNSGKGVPGQTGNTTQPGQAGRTGNVGQAGNSQQALMLQRGDKLIGLKVQDASGADLGRIDDLVLRADGSIAYAVISAEGRNDQIPVPWSALRFESAGTKTGDMDRELGGKESKGDERMTGDQRDPNALRSDYTHATLVGVDAARFRTAPHFDRNNWPRDTDRTIWGQSDAFFGVRPGVGGRDSGVGAGQGGQTGQTGTGAGQTGVGTGQVSSSTTFFRASKLENQAIVDAQGQPIGKLGDLAFDPRGGRVNFAAIRIDDRTGAGAGRTIAMPWESLRASRMEDKDRFQTTIPSERLEGAPQFTTGDAGWKQMSDPTWVNNLYGYYNVRPYWNQGATPVDNSPKPKPTTPGTPPSGAKPIGKA
jgi:sporulation protein YlmC with PRC-barrel domain